MAATNTDTPVCPYCKESIKPKATRYSWKSLKKLVCIILGKIWLNLKKLKGRAEGQREKVKKRLTGANSMQTEDKCIYLSLT